MSLVLKKCGQLKWEIHIDQMKHLVDVTDNEIRDKNSDNYLYVAAINDGWDVGSLHGQVTQELEYRDPVHCQFTLRI